MTTGYARPPPGVGTSSWVAITPRGPSQPLSIGEGVLYPPSDGLGMGGMAADVPAPSLPRMGIRVIPDKTLITLKCVLVLSGIFLMRGRLKQTALPVGGAFLLNQHLTAHSISFYLEFLLTIAAGGGRCS